MCMCVRMCAYKGHVNMCLVCECMGMHVGMCVCVHGMCVCECVCLCVYMCRYVHASVYHVSIYMCVHVSLCAYICVQVICTCKYTFTCITCMCVHRYAHMYVCVYIVCIHVCAHVCVCVSVCVCLWGWTTQLHRWLWLQPAWLPALAPREENPVRLSDWGKPVSGAP